MIKPWEKISSKPAADFRIFSIRTDRKVSPRTNNPHDFYVIDCVNWVNVVAITEDQKMVMVEQYRHGSNTVELEIPGGMMDAEDVSPEVTAARELREETGYEGDSIKVIGRVLPNPAIMSNVCFTVLIENCRCIHPVEFDHGEISRPASCPWPTYLIWLPREESSIHSSSRGFIAMSFRKGDDNPPP